MKIQITHHHINYKSEAINLKDGKDIPELKYKTFNEGDVINIENSSPCICCKCVITDDGFLITSNNYKEI